MDLLCRGCSRLIDYEDLQTRPSGDYNDAPESYCGHCGSSEVVQWNAEEVDNVLRDLQNWLIKSGANYKELKDMSTLVQNVRWWVEAQ